MDDNSPIIPALILFAGVFALVLAINLHKRGNSAKTAFLAALKVKS